MLNHIAIRLEDDCIRFDCAECGLGEELDVSYLGYQNTPDPHFQLTCKKCGFHMIQKGNGVVWSGLPVHPVPTTRGVGPEVE